MTSESLWYDPVKDEIWISRFTYLSTCRFFFNGNGRYFYCPFEHRPTAYRHFVFIGEL